MSDIIKTEAELADDRLVEIAKKINGWEPDPHGETQDNIQSMADALFGVIEASNARIQRLQLKLGQLVERGP